MNLFKSFFFIYLFFLTFLCLSPFAETIEGASDPLKEKRDFKFSVAPLLGYNPTYSAFIGVGLFTEWYEHTKFSTLFIFTLKKVYRIEPQFSHQFNSVYSLESEFQFNNGFEPYFGITNTNSAIDEKEVFGYQYLARIGIKRTHNQHFNSTLFLPFFHWNNQHSRNASPDLLKKIPSQYYYGVELRNTYNKSYKKEGVTSGWELRNDLFYHFNPRQIVKTELGLKYFFPIGDKMGFAFHTLGGLGYGEKKYFNYFFLGGTDRLRGYFKNRFGGSHFILQQNELRFPLFFRILHGVTFIDIGEVFNPLESLRIKYTYGFGLRYILPPDFIEIIRLDVGFSRDQWGIFFDFGQSF